MQHAGLQPAHVEQVRNECGEAVGLVVGPHDIGLAQARRRRLDRRQRRPQIVRHRLEQRRTQLVGLRQLRRLRGGLGKRRVLARGRELRGERVEHLAVGAREPAADQREIHAFTERERQIRGAGCRRRIRPRARFDEPRLARLREHRRAVEPERRPHEHDEIGERIIVLHVGRETGKHLGVGAGARRIPSSARRRIDEGAHDTGDDEEHDEGEHVFALLDREGVQRRREVVVGAEEGHDRGPDRHHRPADRGRHDHEQQEQQEYRREREVVARLGQRHGEQRQPDGGDGEARQPAPDRECRRTTDAMAARPIARPLLLFGLRDHVEVDRARQPDHPIDHRSPCQLVPA